MKTRTLLAIGLMACGAVTAGVAAADPAGDAFEKRMLAASAPVLIQAGSQQVLLAVTDDNFAVYQEGQTVYASQLVPGAKRRVVTQVPAGNVPQALQVNNVVLLWTNPQRQLSGFGVSPLVSWSGLTGTKQLSASSAVGLVAADVSPDSKQVLYPTRTLADGSRGDLELTDLFTGKVTTLLTDIPLGFPNARCRPLAAFEGLPPFVARPTAVYCASGQTTATLSQWVVGRRVDLIDKVATPLSFILQSNPLENAFFVRRAGSGIPAVVTINGSVTELDQAAGTQGFIDWNNVAFYDARVSPTQLELRAASGKIAPGTLLPQFIGPVVSIYNGAGYAKRRTLSPDGRTALVTSTSTFGGQLTDILLLDATTRTVRTVDSQPVNFRADEVFTADSRFVLYSSNVDFNTGLTALFAADLKGNARQVSDDSTFFGNFAGTGSVVSFTDHPVFVAAPANTGAFSTADLRVADVSKTAVPRLVASQVNLFYFPSYKRQAVTYTTDAGVPGLYVAAARP